MNENDSDPEWTDVGHIDTGTELTWDSKYGRWIDMSTLPKTIEFTGSMTREQVAQASRIWDVMKEQERQQRRDIRAVRQARLPGPLWLYETRAEHRRVSRLASERKRRDRRGWKHGRPPPRGMSSFTGGRPLPLPNLGASLAKLQGSWWRLGYAAEGAALAFRKFEVADSSPTGRTAGVTPVWVVEDEVAHFQKQRDV